MNSLAMMNEHIHTTRDGRKIPLSSLETDHLRHIVGYIKRRAEEGIMVGCEDCVDKIYDEEALDEMKYKQYVEELERR